MSLVDKRELVCFRELRFGKDGNLSFPISVYPQLKAIFDEIHRRDDVTISLKQAATAAVTQ